MSVLDAAKAAAANPDDNSGGPPSFRLRCVRLLPWPLRELLPGLDAELDTTDGAGGATYERVVLRFSDPSAPLKTAPRRKHPNPAINSKRVGNESGSLFRAGSGKATATVAESPVETCLQQMLVPMLVDTQLDANRRLAKKQKRVGPSGGQQPTGPALES